MSSVNSQLSRISQTIGGLSLVNGLVKTGSSSQVNIFVSPTPVTLTPTSTTVTALSVLSGVLIQAPTGAQTLTLPSAAVFQAALPNNVAGDSFKFTVINTGSANITLAVDASGSLTGSPTISAGGSANYLFRTVSAGSAYTVYRV
jgi:hypothetical protein